MEKNNNVLHIIIVLVIGAIAAFFIWKGNELEHNNLPQPPPAQIVVTPPPTEPANPRVENNIYGFSYEYPKSVFAKSSVSYQLPFFSGNEKVQSDRLTHTAPYQYCNPKGDCFPETVDIQVTIAPTDKPMSDLVKTIEKSYGPMQSVTIGSNTFKTVLAGVEGEGEVYYVITLPNNKSLLVTRKFLDENTLIGYKDKPGFIVFSEQDRLTKNILESLQIDLQPQI